MDCIADSLSQSILDFIIDDSYIVYTLPFFRSSTRVLTLRSEEKADYIVEIRASLTSGADTTLDNVFLIALCTSGSLKSLIASSLLLPESDLTFIAYIPT